MHEPDNLPPPRAEAPEMPGPQPPTIRDMMVITAAIGLGLALARCQKPALSLFSEHAGWWYLRTLCTLALPLTWAIVALRLIGPRPSRSRLFAPPGIAACMAVAIASTVAFATASHYLASRYNSWSSPAIWIPLLAWTRDPRSLAGAVAAVWLIQVLECRWRPEPNWLDRIGRVLGLFWLLASLAMPVLFILDR